jgi:hypothetical protein
MMVLILSLALLLILGYTIYSLTRHDALYAEAEELARTVPLNKLQAEDRSLGVPVWTFFIAGALLTGTFAVQFFAGSDDPSSFTTSQMVYAGIGCIMTLAITMAQKSLYSSIHTSKAGLLITFLILLFVIFSEIATSSERTDMLVKHRSENSAVYQGVVGSINAPTAPANVNTAGLAEAQAEAAKAQVEIEACERHRPKGQARVDKCLRIERGNLAAAEGKIKAIQGQNEFMANSAMQMKLQLVDKAKELQYDEDQNPAIVKFLKALFGGEILFSMILASLIAVVAFESGFHFTGTRRAVIRHALLLKLGVDDAIKQPDSLPAQKKTELNQWNRKLAESGIESPHDPAMNQQADKQQIDRIVERGRSAVPAEPEQSEMTVYTAVEQSEQSGYAADDQLFQSWKMAVIAEEIGTTARGCKQVIEADRGVTISMRESYPIWNVWGERGLNDGFLTLNPDHTDKNRKPKYLLSGKYRNKILGTREQQLSMV